MRRRLGFLAVTLITFAAPAAAQPGAPPRDDSYVRRVMELRQAVVDHPEDLGRRFTLARTLESMGRVDEAETTLLEAKATKPGDETYTQLTTFYHRQGKFEKGMEALAEWAAADPANKQIHYKIASYYWDRAYRTPTLTPEQKLALIVRGREAIDRALAIDREYLDAIVYKALLIRVQATELESNPEQRRSLLAEAEQLQARAKELQQQRVAARARTSPTEPPTPAPSGAGSSSTLPAPVRVGGNVRPPTKILDVPPVYPPEAQAARVQGIVIAEVRIGEDGRVADARVLRSIPLLDAAALDAVRQWQYTPTLLNGAPVPVIMTVTVNFTLQPQF